MEYKHNASRNRMEAFFSAHERGNLFQATSDIAQDYRLSRQLSDTDCAMLESMWESMAANERDGHAIWSITEKQWQYLKGLIRKIHPRGNLLLMVFHDPNESAYPARLVNSRPSGSGTNILRERMMALAQNFRPGQSSSAHPKQH